MWHTLTDDALAVRGLARRFRDEVIDPIEPHVHAWAEDPDARFPWEVVEEGSRRGLRTLAVPPRARRRRGQRTAAVPGPLRNSRPATWASR